MKIKTIIITLLIATLAIGMISVVSASEITIDPNTSGGLKGAVGSANNGDTIFLKDGVYTGTDNINIKILKNIKIKGQGSKVVLDAKGKSRILSFEENTVSIENIKFTNGKKEGYSQDDDGGGAISAIKTKLTVKNCIFTNNIVKENDGGAIFSYRGFLTISGSTFTNNNAQGFAFGGAISSLTGGIGRNSIIISKCTFNNNKARVGGAIETTSAKVKIASCKFTKNNADNGGAISGRHSDIIVSKSTFNSNKAKIDGGAIESTSKITKKNQYVLKIVDTKFNNNIAGKKYNAIYKMATVKLTKKNVKISPKDDTKV